MKSLCLSVAAATRGPRSRHRRGRSGGRAFWDRASYGQANAVNSVVVSCRARIAKGPDRSGPLKSSGRKAGLALLGRRQPHILAVVVAVAWRRLERFLGRVEDQIALAVLLCDLQRLKRYGDVLFAD